MIGQTFLKVRSSTIGRLRRPQPLAGYADQSKQLHRGATQRSGVILGPRPLDQSKPKAPFKHFPNSLTDGGYRHHPGKVYSWHRCVDDLVLTR